MMGIQRGSFHFYVISEYWSHPMADWGLRIWDLKIEYDLIEGVGEFFYYSLVIPAKAGIQRSLVGSTGSPPARA